jgi:two-component system NtrC family sensor kinase
MRRLFASLGVRLFFWIFALMVVVLAAFAYLSIDRTTNAWMLSFEQQTAQTTAVIERAVRYGMLLNRKEDVHATLRNIAKEPGINAIRIYDKSGATIFSTRPEEIGRRVDRNAEACVVCHRPGEPPTAVLNTEARTRTFRDANGNLILGRIHPIPNEPQCSSAPCHAHPAEKSILGVLDLKMNIDVVDQSKRRAEQTLLHATLLMALVWGGAVALVIWRFVRRPVRDLAEGTRRIAAGELDTRIELNKTGEMGELAEAFNKMTEDLARAREQEKQWEDELEAAVRRKTEELSRAQSQMVHMEKMASLGKLAATVAHELNNPLAGILVYAKLVARDLGSGELSAESRAEMLRHLQAISQESSRCGDIVRNLLTFARQSKPNFAEHHFNEVIERSLMTVQHLIKLGGVTSSVHLIEGDDVVDGDANQLQQALVALLVNAVEAMRSGGELGIRALGRDHEVEVEISDTGVGISPDVLPNIYEPFVSTKGDEKGVGLGLAVAYGIIRRHEGTISVESEVGAGTTFRVVLPRQYSPDDDAAYSGRGAAPSTA